MEKTVEKSTEVTTAAETAVTEKSQPETPSRIMQPRVDIVEREDAIELYADMPGVPADAVEVTLEHNTLMVHGNDTVRNRIWQRAFKLTSTIDHDNIYATVNNGVLMLTLHRIPEVTTRKQITVSASK